MQLLTSSLITSREALAMMLFSAIMEQNAMYDCIIVGAGIEGSATAYQLAKKQCKTLLLEQFFLPHSRGSSHGQSRATRYAYRDKTYAQMMQEAYPMWDQLEKETNTTLYRQTGLLVLQEPGNGSFEARVESVKNMGLPMTELNGEEVTKLYPGTQYSDEHKAVIEHKAGILLANKCLYHFRFVELGGRIQDGEQMTEILPGNVVTVRTNKGEYQAKSVILTVGPWAGQVLKKLGLNPPLVTWRMNVCYWKQKHPGSFDPEFPAFVELAVNDRYLIPNRKLPGHIGILYGLPMQEYPGMIKIGYHTGNKPMLPDERDKHARDIVQWDIKMMQKYVRDHFPGLEDEPAVVEQCMYTKTPDEHPILDKHPVYHNIVLGCGFSGHGFKLAPVVGKILSELALDQPPSYDLTIFRLNRFDKKVSTFTAKL